MVDTQECLGNPEQEDGEMIKEMVLTDNGSSRHKVILYLVKD